MNDNIAIGYSDFLARLEYYEWAWKASADYVMKEFKSNLSDKSSSRLTITGTFMTEVKVNAYPEAYNPRTHDQHSSYYIPPYFSIFGSDRPQVTTPIRLPHCKVQKNIRPKGTHTNRKFYR